MSIEATNFHPAEQWYLDEKNRENGSFLQKISPEAQSHIFSFLFKKDLPVIQRVCKAFRDLFDTTGKLKPHQTRVYPTYRELICKRLILLWNKQSDPLGAFNPFFENLNKNQLNDVQELYLKEEFWRLTADLRKELQEIQAHTLFTSKLNSSQLLQMISWIQSPSFKFFLDFFESLHSSVPTMLAKSSEFFRSQLAAQKIGEISQKIKDIGNECKESFWKRMRPVHLQIENLFKGNIDHPLSLNKVLTKLYNLGVNERKEKLDRKLNQIPRLLDRIVQLHSQNYWNKFRNKIIDSLVYSIDSTKFKICSLLFLIVQEHINNRFKPPFPPDKNSNPFYEISSILGQTANFGFFISILLFPITGIFYQYSQQNHTASKIHTMSTLVFYTLALLHFGITSGMLLTQALSKM